MHKINFYKCYKVLIVIFISCSSNTAQNLLAPSKVAYDTYHGITISDPYRNLENIKDSLVMNWMKNESIYADQLLNKLDGRDVLIEKLKAFDQKSLFRIYRTKKTNDGKYFYLKKEQKSSEVNVSYRDSLKGEEHFLYVSSTDSITKDYTINHIMPNWKGDKLAISLAKSGNEIGITIILDVQTKKNTKVVLENTAPNVLNGIQWLPDDSGFIYTYFPYTDPNSSDYWLETKSVLYKIGTNPIERNIILETGVDENINLRKEDFPIISIYHQEDKYVYAKVEGAETFNDTYYKKIEDLTNKNIPWKTLFTKKDKVIRFTPSKENIYFLTAKENPNYEIGITDLHNPDFEKFEVVSESTENRLITDYELTKDGLFYVIEKNGVEATLHFKDDNQTRIIDMPTKSGRITIASLGTNYTDLWVAGRGWLNESITYKFDVKNDKFDRLVLNEPVDYSEFDNLEIDEIEIRSHDGIMLPVSIIKQKGVKLDGENRVLLYGYGSYGASVKPFFNTLFLTWVTEGGILVVPHVRGGGEKGNEWHNEGSKIKKSNTWKDLIACTEYLINKRYTNPSKIAVWGTSAGGIMAGKAITTRPELYATAIFISPAMNMLRSEIQPNGLNSIKEFGTVEKEEEFKALLAMDSYHSIKENIKYPSVYVYAGAKDGRVVVWDSAKFVARLRANTSSKKPILFDVNFESGHGGSNTLNAEVYKLYANNLSFALWQTGHPDYQLKE